VALMSAEDRNGEVSTDEQCTDCTTQERSLDELTRGLASATVSRRGALRLLAGALFGGVLASAPGLGRTAQAAPGDGPGGSPTCANSGQSCTAQQCCGGFTCLTDETSGTEKFCCPDTNFICGQSCCPDGGICDPLDGKVCVCPNGGISCRSLTADPLTEGNRRIGECCDAVDELCCDGACCDKQKCQTCALDANGRLNCVTCATGGACCPSSVPGVPGVCCDTATTKCLQTAAGPVCCPTARVCGNTCLAAACDPSKCEACDETSGTCQSVCKEAGAVCCQGNPGQPGTCCVTNNPTTGEPVAKCLKTATGAGICCPTALVCGQTCLATACDPGKCEACDETSGTCQSVCKEAGAVCCQGKNGGAGTCCVTTANGTTVAQCLNEPTTGAGICCPQARVCGNTCLATACDPTQCQVCDPLNGRCVSTCPTGQTCPSCTAPKVLDPTTCSCVCATVVTCTPPKVFNQNTCKCECPGTCGENQVFNDQCVCVCDPSGRTCPDGKCCPPDTACDCRPRPGGGVQCNCRRLES
jgi:hypothetical protein